MKIDRPPVNSLPVTPSQTFVSCTASLCFSPNLRAIIATEEAISNLNETPPPAPSLSTHTRESLPASGGAKIRPVYYIHSSSLRAEMTDVIYAR